MKRILVFTLALLMILGGCRTANKREKKEDVFDHLAETDERGKETLVPASPEPTP